MQAQEYIVATEAGILHQMQLASPEKVFIPAPPTNNCACNDCPHMKLNTLEKLYLCMQYEQPELLMDQELMDGGAKTDRADAGDQRPIMAYRYN